MTTRIRYKQSGNSLFVTQEFQVLDKVYWARYDISNHIMEIFDVQSSTIIQYTVFETPKQAKLWIKSRLKRLGVKFDSEVRRKKKHKQEIEKALEGKQE
jgi:hypothetical protein